MVDTQPKLLDRVVGNLKDFVDQNRVVVIAAAACLALFGLVNIFRKKSGTEKGKGSSYDRSLNKSSRKKHDSEG